MTDLTRGRLYVVAQFALLAVLAFVAPGSLWPTDGWVGVAGWVFIALGGVLLLVAGIQLGAALTALPIPREKATLRTTGLYAIVRHPIYLGLLVLSTGVVVRGASIRHILALGILAYILHMKSRFEERLLTAKFPEYAAYAHRVGKLVPRLDSLFGRKDHR